ncbi:hypothetical protein SMA75_20095 [Escherichia coli]|uniref:hypothetical protein n=1 Tax=Escherichia coli TaxID=562 RepID=UPI0030797215
MSNLEAEAARLRLAMWHFVRALCGLPPEPDYNRIWREQTMRSDVLPNIPGI